MTIRSIAGALAPRHAKTAAMAAIAILLALNSARAAGDAARGATLSSARVVSTGLGAGSAFGLGASRPNGTSPNVSSTPAVTYHSRISLMLKLFSIIC